MGAIASKFAFLPPNPPLPLHADCRYITTLNNVQIPIYFVENRRSNLVLIFSHGNADDLTRCTTFCNYLSNQLQISVLSYEYVGYPHTRAAVESSISQSLTPSEEGCYESIDAAYEYVTNTLGYHDSQQIWVGQSIGSGPTVDLVARLGMRGAQTAGMILISPFYSAVSTVSPFLSNFCDMFCNGAKISHVTTQTLIIHGSIDNVVPQLHSADLKKRCNCAVQRVVVQGAGHNDLFQYPETFDLIENFLTKIKDAQ